jgi:transposase
MAVEGATTSGVFETYVERLLAPALHPGQVVVIWTTSGRTGPKEEGKGVDRGEGLRAPLLAVLLSPDLNPIEEALSKIKHILRKTTARTKEALIEAMGRALAEP